jgi:hypothetical protein
MTFSIRALLIVTALTAVWLAALRTSSILMIEIAGGSSALLILLALPLAIWDRNLNRRPFWTGFFVVAAGTFLLMNVAGAFNNHTEQFARWLATKKVTTPVSSSPTTTFVGDTPVNITVNYKGLDSTTGPTNLTFNTIRSDVAAAVTQWFPFAIALLAGGIGGWITSGMSGRSRGEARVVENA